MKNTIIELIKDNGEQIFNRRKIKEETKRFFENLYGEKEDYDFVDLE